MNVASPSYEAMSKPDLIAIIETQQKIIADLRWHDDIMSNSDLPIAARFAARAVRKFTQTRKPCDDGYYKGYLPTMAELAGVSASTVSRGLETLSEATDALDKYTDEIRDEGGRLEKNLLYFRKNDIFEAAADIIPIKEVPKHGGNRRLPCPDCGCIHRKRKTIEECAACSHKFYENERIILGDEEQETKSLQLATVAESEEQDSDPESLQDATVETPTAESEESLQLATLTVDTRVSACKVLPPAELRALPIWCPWRYEEPEKPRADGRLDKVPYQTRGRVLQKAKPNDATTWTTYDQAQAIYEQSLREGWKRPFEDIGFMCDGSFVGIDLDHCRNKETGEIAAWAQAIIDRFPSYGYITPSEEGIRLVIHAKKPGPRCKKGGIELYEEKRFFTWKPMPLPGTPETIEDCQEQLAALYAETFPEQDAPKEVRQQARVFTPSCQCPDDEVLNKARGAANGPKFRRLYDEGNITGYASQSEAELALCRLLAYYSDGDEDAIDRLMRDWKLFRPEKWDRAARSGETYGQGTIRVAVGGQIAS